MSRINNLGTFTSMANVWRRFPEGGREGDYLTVDDTIYEWNKYTREWTDDTDPTTPAVTNRVFDSSVTVNYDLTVAGAIHGTADNATKWNNHLWSDYIDQPLRTDDDVEFAQVEATKFIVTGGASSKFLKADGSLDSNTYITDDDLDEALGSYATSLALDGDSALVLMSGEETLSSISKSTLRQFLDITGGGGGGGGEIELHSLWGNNYDGTNDVSGALTFTPVAWASRSNSAHLEVVTIDGQQYLYTRLPFFSAQEIAAGGAAVQSGGGGTGSVNGISINGTTYDTPDEDGIIAVTEALLAAPLSGTNGQYLQKTSSGVQWADVSSVGAGQNLTIGNKTYNGSAAVEITAGDLTGILSGKYVKADANTSLGVSEWKLSNLAGNNLFYESSAGLLVGNDTHMLGLNGTQIRLNAEHTNATDGIYIYGMKLPYPTSNNTYLKYASGALSWATAGGGGGTDDTWRHISINGTQKLDNTPGVNNGLNLVAGQNISLNYNNGSLTITSSGSGAWGQETANQSVQLTVASTLKTLSLSTHTHNYLPLSGGTLTGTVNARSLIPVSTRQYDLGSPSKPWKFLYTQYAEIENITMTAGGFYYRDYGQGLENDYAFFISYTDDDDYTIKTTLLEDNIRAQVDTEIYGSAISFFIRSGGGSTFKALDLSYTAGIKMYDNLDMDGCDINNVNDINVDEWVIASECQAKSSFTFIDDDETALAYLKYNPTYNAVYVVGPNGDPVNFYATGEIAAGGAAVDATLAARLAALEAAVQNLNAAMAEIPVFEYYGDSHTLEMNPRSE